jgi:hypothetical protein
MPQAGHCAQFPQLISGQAKQNFCPAFVNSLFSIWLVRHRQRLIHDDAGPVVLFHGQNHRFVDVDIPTCSDAKPNGAF